MMDENRKLKRGLKDVSPLFENSQPLPVPVLPSKEFDIQVMSVYSPDWPKYHLRLNGYFASRLASATRPSSVITLDPPARPGDRGDDRPVLGPHTRHLSLAWEEFVKICQRSNAERGASKQQARNQLIFFDFPFHEPICFEKLVPLLDKWIILVRPTLESMAEAYKMIKASIPLNGRMEYFLVLGETDKNGTGALLFERFSELADKRLGISLSWLGNFPMPQEPNPIAAELLLDGLFTKSVDITAAEKRALAGFVELLPVGVQGLES